MGMASLHTDMEATRSQDMEATRSQDIIHLLSLMGTLNPHFIPTLCTAANLLPLGCTVAKDPCTGNNHQCMGAKAHMVNKETLICNIVKDHIKTHTQNESDDLFCIILAQFAI